MSDDENAPEPESELATHEREKAAEHLDSDPDGDVKSPPFCSSSGVVTESKWLPSAMISGPDSMTSKLWPSTSLNRLLTACSRIEPPTFGPRPLVSWTWLPEKVTRSAEPSCRQM